MRKIALGLGVVATAALATPAAAAEYTFSFDGTVTTAENFSFPDIPEIPMFDAHVGEVAKGSFTFNTDYPFTTDEFTSFEADTFFALPEENYGDDFAGPGGQIYYNSLTGETEITGGRADSYSQFVLYLMLPPSQTFDPGALNGKVGPFTYVAEGPGGFKVSGFLTVGAVPESSTWVLMIAGFGLVGAAMRRSKYVASVRYA